MTTETPRLRPSRVRSSFLKLSTLSVRDEIALLIASIGPALVVLGNQIGFLNLPESIAGPFASGGFAASAVVAQSKWLRLSLSGIATLVAPFALLAML